MTALPLFFKQNFNAGCKHDFVKNDVSSFQVGLGDDMAIIYTLIPYLNNLFLLVFY